MTQTQNLPSLSLPQAHWLVQAPLPVTVDVAMLLFVLASFEAAVASAGMRQDELPGSEYLPPEQVSCLNPYEPGAQPLRHVSKPLTQLVAVEPVLAEFGPVQSTSVLADPVT